MLTIKTLLGSTSRKALIGLLSPQCQRTPWFIFVIIPLI
nr:MAG TPA: hypothetical protein [Caudoviricetes sp.]